MKRPKKEKVQTKRIDSYLHRVVPVKDTDGKESLILLPFGVEFRPRDFLQVIIGATLLGVPVAFTEEVWKISYELPVRNIVLIACLSLFFISVFIYFNYYRYHLKEYALSFVIRIFFIYIGSFFVSVLVLTFLNKGIGVESWLIVFKRTVLVCFPASMSAAISDTLK